MLPSATGHIGLTFHEERPVQNALWPLRLSYRAACFTILMDRSAAMTIRSFITSESGAVTVDWVVLTAALVGLGIAVMSVVSGGVENLSTDIGQQLANTNPLQDPFDGNEDFTGEGDIAAPDP
jgi:Flp pilus assembly pilin Flp